ncbi:hypothetical protein BC830DRAFT_1158458 [Chytriomyces sp. MP71]|nr:hypothetical protein BC830DRAFT_1158458 [Chytriomyces sp. MP71]
MTFRATKNYALVVICFASFTDMLASEISLPILPLIVTDIFNQEPYVSGLVIAAFAPGSILAGPIFG